MSLSVPSPRPPETAVRVVSSRRDRSDYARLLAQQRRWLRREMGVDLVDLQPSAAREYADPFRAYAAAGTVALLARRDDVPTGIAALTPLDPSHCGAVELQRVFVPEQERGRGAGRAIVQAAVEAAAGMGFAEVVLETHEGHMAAAVALYRSVGFVDVEPLGHTGGAGIVTLARSLQPSGRTLRRAAV